MAKLCYLILGSLDGYVADESGGFGWAAPDAEVHAYVNDRMSGVATCLYGRRMYETMVYWETADVSERAPAVARDFARVWQAANKIVYSRTLGHVASARTVLERAFDPEEVRRLKARSDADLGIGGPHLAAHALRAGLVDELELIVAPVIVGGGTAWLPPGYRSALDLVSERRFASGFVDLRYRVRR